MPSCPKEFLSGVLLLIILRTRKNENLQYEKAGLRLGVNITNNPCEKWGKWKQTDDMHFLQHFIESEDEVKVWKWVYIWKMWPMIYTSRCFFLALGYNMTDPKQSIIRHMWQNCQVVKVRKQIYFTDQIILEYWKTQSTLRVYFRVG